MQTKSKYSIIISSDENYITHVITLLSSIETNVRGEKEIFLLGLSLKDTTKSLFKHLFPTLSINFIDLTEEKIKKTLCPTKELNGYMSYSAYARLLIPEIMPTELHKCLYLDADGLVLQDLSSLWDIDISDYYIAGVKDTCSVESKNKVGLSSADLYINSGVLLFNLQKCREDNVIDKFSKFILAYNGNVWHMDQGVINGTLKDGILELPRNYNVLTPLFFFSSKIANKFYSNFNISNQELEEAQNNPLFIHFTKGGTSRPWEHNCKHPYRNLYWEYRLKKGQASNLMKDGRDIKLRCLDWMLRNFPLITMNILKIIN